jgi:hypothetical protein
MLIIIALGRILLVLVARLYSLTSVLCKDPSHVGQAGPEAPADTLLLAACVLPAALERRAFALMVHSRWASANAVGYMGREAAHAMCGRSSWAPLVHW